MSWFKKSKEKTINEYLLNEGYFVHDEREGRKTYCNDLKTVRIDTNPNRVIYNYNGYLLFDISFEPTIIMFKYLLKKSTVEFEQTTGKNNFG